MAMCEVWPLGRMSYQTAFDLQTRLVQERTQPDGVDRLLLVEHPHTYTLGSSGHDEYVLWDEEQRRVADVELFRVDRGGDVTYHGPGQLVGYPIIQLPREELRNNVTGYVRNLESVIIRTLADYDIEGKPIAGLTGVWVDTPAGEAKICAIGVRINVKAVTKHGFALNMNTNLDYFDGIVPCGIHDKGVTSLAQLLGAPVDEAEVIERVIHHFGVVFDCEMVIQPPEWLPNL
jgi:lipoyl(octanoyl) transferase